MTIDEYAGLRGLLWSGRPLTTMLMNIPDPAVAEILGGSGADYVIIDTEHAFFPGQSLRECIAALKASPAYVVVRVGANEEDLVKTVLDLGADGVQIPNVRSAADAERAVAYARYAPAGRRGVGYGRASGYGTRLADYLAEAEATIAVLLMIESGEGVRAAAAIAEVPGVDALIVGPADLATDLGLPVGDTGAEMLEAWRAVIAAGRRRGMAVAVGGGIDDTARWLAEGARVFLHLVDTLALDGVAVAAARASRAAMGVEA